MSADPEDALRASVGYLLALAGAESRRRWTQALSSVGLRSSHFGVLMTLGMLGEASQRRLGVAIGVDPRNLVGIIDQLESEGLVVRQADREDRRRHSVRLTAEGGRLLQELQAAGTAAEEGLLEPLSAKERRQLGRILAKLVPR